MTRARIAVALALLPLASLASGCIAAGLLAAAKIAQPRFERHVYLDPDPALSVTSYAAKVGDEVHVDPSKLPLPEEYLLVRERYRVVIATPVTGEPDASLRASSPDGSPLALEGPALSPCPPGASPEQRCLDAARAERAIDFDVRDASGALLGSERLGYRVERYGTISDANPS